MRRLDTYLMDIAIASNPHVEKPQEIVDTLMNEKRLMMGYQPITEEIDRAGIQAFKEQLAKGESKVGTKVK